MAEDLSEEVCELQLQNELLMGRNQQLQKEISLLKNQLHHSSEYSMAINNAYEVTVSDNMKLAISKKSYQFTADFINKDDAKTQFYAGLPSNDVFETLFSLLEKSFQSRFLEKNSSKSRCEKKCTLKDELFITLTKLKLGLINQDIAYRTNLSTSKVSEIFHRWPDIMYKELR